jgi:predicted kinase
MSSQPTMYLICGKIAAGKSTLARSLATRPATLLISEDHWTSRLFLNELKTIDDYRRCSAKLRDAMGPHVVAILQAGVSVVLDFPANGKDNRKWMRSLIDQSHAAHELHFLDVPDEICRQRLRERNESGKHPFKTSENDYDLFTSYFDPPTLDEGFYVVVHGVDDASRSFRRRLHALKPLGASLSNVVDFPRKIAAANLLFYVCGGNAWKPVFNRISRDCLVNRWRPEHARTIMA